MTKQNETTKQMINDLQKDIDILRELDSDIEVIRALDRLQDDGAFKKSADLIRRSLKKQEHNNESREQVGALKGAMQVFEMHLKGTVSNWETIPNVVRVEQAIEKAKSNISL